jgi:hypothetical protein
MGIVPAEAAPAAAGISGKLGITGDKLRMLLPADCPPELKSAIRRHKPALLELLRLNFLVARSDTLKTTVFWTPDEATKEFLTDFGGDIKIGTTPDRTEDVHICA